MSTQAQQAANAANSRLSNGPATEAGKQKAAQNSAKHYLTAKQIVVPGEDPENYNELHQGLHKSWTPTNAQEAILVEQIAQNAWRLMRVRRIEAALFTRMMPSLNPGPPVLPGTTRHKVPANHEAAMLRAFQDHTRDFDNLRRYTTPIERAYHNAIAELTKLQKQRKITEIGSVSQSSKQPPATNAPAPELMEKPISAQQGVFTANNEILRN